MRTVFLDTSGIVAAMNNRDANNEKAKRIFYQLAEENSVLLITNYIRAETHALLLQRAGKKIALNFLADKSWVIEWVDPEDEEKALNIIYQYEDKSFSLTDATCSHQKVLFLLRVEIGSNAVV